MSKVTYEIPHNLSSSGSVGGGTVSDCAPGPSEPLGEAPMSPSPTDESGHCMVSLDQDSSAFYSITYLGSTEVAPSTTLGALQRVITSLKGSVPFTMKVVLVVGGQLRDHIRLVDPVNGKDLARYPIHALSSCCRGIDEGEADCCAFVLFHDGIQAPHCHVLSCQDSETSERVVECLQQAMNRFKVPPTLPVRYIVKKTSDVHTQLSNSSWCNKFSIRLTLTLDIMEDDGKGSFVSVHREKNFFKLRRDLRKKLVLTIEHHHEASNFNSHLERFFYGPFSEEHQPQQYPPVPIERCFGLLLSPGEKPPTQMLLLDPFHFEVKDFGLTCIIDGIWEPNLESLAELNVLSGKDQTCSFCVAADVVLKDLRNPIRFTKTVRARVYPTNEKFWNIAKPKISEECLVSLVLVNQDPLEYDYLSLSMPHQSTSPVPSGNNLGGGPSSEPAGSVTDDEEDPLLSGTGTVKRDFSEEYLATWRGIVQMWRETKMRPGCVQKLVEEGLPDTYRMEIWLLLVNLYNNEDEIFQRYTELLSKESSYERVIWYDVSRTFPAHAHFKDQKGDGQTGLFRVSKAYSLYDEDVGYCQGLSFIIAVFLLQLPEEKAFAMLTRLMYNYNHREMYLNNFEGLHRKLFMLERLLKDRMPDLHDHMKAQNVEMHMFASQWFLTLFTAKFPLSLAFTAMDMLLAEDDGTTVFRLSLGLLKMAHHSLLKLDFEGILRYFRVSLPKKFVTQEGCDSFLRLVSRQKVLRVQVEALRQDYELYKEEMEACQDGSRLMQNYLRQELELDQLAWELVNTQVRSQEEKTQLEEQSNNLQLELEHIRRHVVEVELTNRTLRDEYDKVKDMWREDVGISEVESRKKDSIIADYKSICHKLEAQVKAVESKHNELCSQLTTSTYLCNSCRKELSNIASCLSSPEVEFSGLPEGATPSGTSLGGCGGGLSCEEAVLDLGVELAKTKLELVESECRCQALQHQLQTIAVQQGSSTWFKKFTGALPRK